MLGPQGGCMRDSPGTGALACGESVTHRALTVIYEELGAWP